MIWPPPGKSGPGSFAEQVFERGLRVPSISSAAAATSRRLCEGISVAMPTAMPDAPLSSTNGKRAGSSFGSWIEPS